MKLDHLCEDLVQRINLALQERGLPGLVWRQTPEDGCGLQASPTRHSASPVRRSADPTPTNLAASLFNTSTHSGAGSLARVTASQISQTFGKPRLSTGCTGRGCADALRPRPVNGGRAGPCNRPPLPYTQEHLSTIRSNAHICGCSGRYLAANPGPAPCGAARIVFM
jgi:hypothetical protein